MRKRRDQREGGRAHLLHGQLDPRPTELQPVGVDDIQDSHGEPELGEL